MRRVVIVDFSKQQNKLDPKFYPLIWIGLVFATIFNNFYDLYYTFATMEATRLELIYTVSVELLSSVGIPTVLCFLVPTIIYNGGAKKRGLIAIPRKDFIYITMIFMIIARVVLGVINIFNFVDENLSLYTMFSLEILIVTLAMYLMYFLVLVPKYHLNDWQKHKTFNYYAKEYIVALGIVYLLSIFSILYLLFVLGDPEIMEILEGGGSAISFGVSWEELVIALEYYKDVFLATCISGLVLYFVALGITIGLNFTLKKKAEKYRDEHPAEFVPPTMQGFNPYGGRVVGNPFEEQGGDNPFGEDMNSQNPFDENNNDDNPFGDIE